eukprot:SAG22_NODE_12760_length_430_cov_0.975831_1_plen_78_part_10
MFARLQLNFVSVPSIVASSSNPWCVALHAGTHVPGKLLLYYSQNALWLATTVHNCTPLGGVLTIQKLGDSQDPDLRLP